MNLVQILIIVAACAAFALARMALRRLSEDQCRPALRRVLLVFMGVMAAWWGVANYLSAEYSANWRAPHGTSLADARARGYFFAAPSSVLWKGMWRVRDVWTERVMREVHPLPLVRLRFPTGQLRVIVRLEEGVPAVPPRLDLCVLSTGSAIPLHEDGPGVWVGPVPDPAYGRDPARPSLDSVRVAVLPGGCRESR